MFKKKEEKNLCLSWGCHGGSGSIVIESFFLFFEMGSFSDSKIITSIKIY